MFAYVYLSTETGGTTAGREALRFWRPKFLQPLLWRMSARPKHVSMSFGGDADAREVMFDRLYRAGSLPAELPAVSRESEALGTKGGEVFRG